MLNNQNYKINLHILEGCNYHCKHCFAHFGSHKTLSLDLWKKIVDNCLKFPVSEFNLAGGEPTLYKDLIPLAEYIRSKGKKVSLITNGSCIDYKWIQQNAKLWTTIGFSVDSFTDSTLKNLGRISKSGNQFTLTRLKECCKEIKKYNPECQIKMNTVVSAINKDEIFYDFPDVISKWKIIKVKLYESEQFSNKDILITDDEFRSFAKRNLVMLMNQLSVSLDSDNLQSQIFEIKPQQTVVIEYTTSGSYIIVDANGYLLDNYVENVYQPVSNLLEEDLLDGLRKLHFDKERYWSRYKAVDR